MADRPDYPGSAAPAPQLPLEHRIRRHLSWGVALTLLALLVLLVVAIIAFFPALSSWVSSLLDFVRDHPETLRQ